MKIKNKKNKGNYLNYKIGGVSKKVMIPAGKTVKVSSLKSLAQVLNLGDFKRGFFEVVEEVEVIESNAVKESKKKKSEDTLDKVEKEVKNYTDNKKNKK